MQLVDTHAHLDDEQFTDSLHAVIQRAAEAGVSQIVAVGCTAASSSACIAIAEAFQGVRAAVGIQPNYCAEAAGDDWQRIVQLAEHRQVVAIGETGLDRHWDYAPFELQQDFFKRHMQLARRFDLPFVVHMRDCPRETLEALEDQARQGPLKGVMHSFTGDSELAFRCLQLGLHISFAGMLTFKKSSALRELAREIPADRLLIETDSPYLSPHPKRGQRPNEPALLAHTAECLATVRSIPLQDLAEQTTENARRLFSLDDAP